MAEYSNENRGAIWRNEKKELDTHPDFTGSLNVNGVDYWVNAWKRKSDANEKAPALSFSIKEKESAIKKPIQNTYSHNNAGTTLPPTKDFDSFDDDIPF